MYEKPETFPSSSSLKLSTLGSYSRYCSDCSSFKLSNFFYISRPYLGSYRLSLSKIYFCLLIRAKDCLILLLAAAAACRCGQRSFIKTVEII